MCVRTGLGVAQHCVHIQLVAETRPPAVLKTARCLGDRGVILACLKGRGKKIAKARGAENDAESCKWLT
eukprot:6201082-Pleurochrysis_carterae.AAC.1